VAETESCIWTGESGKEYTYHVYQLPHSFADDQDGNYIYTKTENQSYIPIYIGQGDLGDRIGPDHHQATCIANKGASHVHAHLNPNEQNRKKEEGDLLAIYTMAYSPTGCNEKEGG